MKGQESFAYFLIKVVIRVKSMEFGSCSDKRKQIINEPSVKEIRKKL
jgi:hypothetical protein